MEELEAIDWYQQRVDATGDAALREILAHNRDEEKEHAAMVLEWLRRQDEGFDRYLRMYLFTDRPVLAIEEAGDGTEPPAPPPMAGADRPLTEPCSSHRFDSHDNLDHATAFGTRAGATPDAAPRPVDHASGEVRHGRGDNHHGT